MARVSVEGSALMNELVETLSRFVVLPTGAPVAVALWIVHAYVIDGVFITPILAIVSPVKTLISASVRHASSSGR